MTSPAVSVKVREVQYVAPSHALQAGEVLGANNTDLVSWPEAVPVEGASTRIADVLGREVLFPLAQGQPILDRDLSAAGSGTGLASKIPDGMRGVALRSDEVVGVAGFLIPGSHLDVLVTYRPDNSPEPLTATVLQDAVVIAAGHQTEPDPTGKTTTDAAVVTLLLTPDESQRAVLASTQGAIHFVLRNGADTTRSTDAPVLLSQLAVRPSTGGRPVARVPAPASAPAPKRREIETVLGGVAGESNAAAASGRGAGQ
jgi:pilus assembly protein CpaB